MSRMCEGHMLQDQRSPSLRDLVRLDGKWAGVSLTSLPWSQELGAGEKWSELNLMCRRVLS